MIFLDTGVLSVCLRLWEVSLLKGLFEEVVVSVGVCCLVL